ncbi:hypothetical protein PCANC_23678 [Puccinia coronata f. sp. avenae]|uniref:Uncharacterized protein n=1 Tax=Puccinia coronata f. sp. avenae TaxID=200324 RepID=A0A2N5UAJ4_9BASI|nr:hypothetical protein PCANC_23678 [Puccinia coronata f. sp. avenae]
MAIIADFNSAIGFELAFPNVSSSGSPVSRTAHHPELVSALLTWGLQLLQYCQSYAKFFEIMQQIIQIDLGRLDAMRRYEGARTDPSLLFRSTFEEGLIGHLIGAGYITYLY